MEDRTVLPFSFVEQIEKTKTVDSKLKQADCAAPGVYQR